MVSRLGFEGGPTADGVNSNCVIFPGFSHFVSSFSPHSYSLPLPLFVYVLPLQIYVIPFQSPFLYIFFSSFFFSCYIFILFINFHRLPFPVSSCSPFLSAQWCVQLPLSPGGHSGMNTKYSVYDHRCSVSLWWGSRQEKVQS